MKRDNSYLDKSGPAICRQCGITGFRERAERFIKTKKYVYRDKNGRSWNRMQCPDCVVVARKSPRRFLTDHKNKKGFDSELIVKNVFEKMGYFVTQTEAHGPDLTIHSLSLTCEVKSATKEKKCNRYFCSAVYTKRRDDDLMVIVFDESHIIIESMKYHLSKCTASGGRTLNKEYKNIYGKLS